MSEPNQTGISTSTFLLIACGGDDVRASSYTTLEGTAIPIVERRHGDAWWPLVTWDGLRMPPADAKDYAQHFIDRVRQEATRLPFTVWCDPLRSPSATCHGELLSAPIPPWHRWILAPYIKPSIHWPQGGWECATPAPECIGAVAPLPSVHMVP